MRQKTIAVTDEEVIEMMNVQEVARMTEWLRVYGLTDTDINDCMIYIATGVGLPEKEQKPKEK